MNDARVPGETQVCVIGAGAAGSIVAAELARRGIRVVVLEAGPRHERSRRGEYSKQYLRGEDPWRTPIREIDRYTTDGRIAYPFGWKRARGVGGSTLHWEGYTLRLDADDFRLRSQYGVADDWPIGYDTLEPYYASAEAALGVAGEPDDIWASPRSKPFPLPAFPFSFSDQIFAKACQALGVAFQHLPQARNSIAYGGRAACQACGTCAACPTGAKASVDLTHVSEAEATGHAQVVSDVSVLRLESGASREVTDAIYAGYDRVQRRLGAKVFVVAAGAVETVRLLSLSTSRRFPTGLANGSGLVGKRFMSHPAIDVIGRIPARVYPYRIGFSTAMSRQFAVNRDRAQQGAFLFEFLNSAEPTPAALAVSSGRWGQELRRYVEQEFGHTVGIRVYCEQLPDPANTVTVNRDVTDYFESPVPHITYDVGPYEHRALEQAKQIAARILLAAGARDIRASGLTFAAHQIGTTRMGTDPGTSVVDSNLRAHDVPNLFLVGSGCFVTASSSPPTLTIAALAIRAAEHIATHII